MNTPKMSRMPISDVIVILPGILGSVLERQNRKLWAPSRLSLLSALIQLGRNFDSLNLNDAASGAAISDGGVAASGLVSDVHLIPWLWKIDGYTQLTNCVCTRFDVVPGRNYFEFAYDWRLDNRIAADRLACLSRAWLQDWRQTSGASDARLIVIAHSMGGLVARYFLEVLDGWRNTRMLITFGTPFRGSLNALDYLVNGFRKFSGFVDLAHLIRSFPSVYQLIPIYPCIETDLGRLVYVRDMADRLEISRERVLAGEAFHREIEAAVERNRRDEEYLRKGTWIHPIIGMRQPTLQSAYLRDGRLLVSYHYQHEDEDGDGTVPRVSAIPIELSDMRCEIAHPERHASLQNGFAALTQVESFLRGRPRPDMRAWSPVAISLDFEDAYAAGEPIVFRVRTDAWHSDVDFTVERIETGETVTGGAIADQDAEWRAAALPPLTPGTYRLRLAAGPAGATARVTDVFLVAATGGSP